MEAVGEIGLLCKNGLLTCRLLLDFLHVAEILLFPRVSHHQHFCKFALFRHLVCRFSFIPFHGFVVLVFLKSDRIARVNFDRFQ